MQILNGKRMIYEIWTENSVTIINGLIISGSDVMTLSFKSVIKQLTAAICLIYHTLNSAVTFPTTWQLPSYLTWGTF